MESSKHRATLGKRLLKLQVTGLNGEQIDFGRATGRYFAKILTIATLLIGYFMALFTPKKQALHDMLAGTVVVNAR